MAGSFNLVSGAGFDGLLSQNYNLDSDAEVTVAFAATYHLESPTLIVFFPSAYDRFTRTIFVSTGTPAYLGGLLSVTFLHELIHVCLGTAGDMMTQACEETGDSCTELGLDWAIYDIMCGQVTEIAGEHCDSNDWEDDCPEDIFDILLGICDALKLIELKWVAHESEIEDCNTGMTGCPYRGAQLGCPVGPGTYPESVGDFMCEDCMHTGSH